VCQYVQWPYVRQHPAKPVYRMRSLAVIAEMKIDPLVAATFSQFEARRAVELSANGGLEGENVLKST